MGVQIQEYSTPISVPPARVFKAMSIDIHNLFPKIVDIIESVELSEGTGEAGTIKKLNIIEGGKPKYVLHRVDEIDEAKFVYNFSITGGTGLAETLEKVSFKSQLVETPNGGTIRNVHVDYFTKGDYVVTEEELKAGQAKVEGLVKLCEGFLLANPDY
ncbi:pathogenesis-related protein 10-like [Trifolium pratense]|uniref:Uncharacterized protein n=2 Tax=Trifolium pratense TaxID=57577 RepID=A0ACB0KYT9_TRIPR|nr:pathogenesis-related protein 10-like [Trifolium pratense]CAJ2662329.1 unnamed protein product [Trifolium pratense]